VLVRVLVFLEEHVGIVLAEVLDLLDVLDIGDLFLGAGLFLVRFLERHDLGTARLDRLFDFFLVLVLGLRPGLAAQRRVLLELGPRIGLAGIRRDDGVAIEVVELLAGLRVFALGAAILLFGQFLPLQLVRAARLGWSG